MGVEHRYGSTMAVAAPSAEPATMRRGSGSCRPASRLPLLLPPGPGGALVVRAPLILRGVAFAADLDLILSETSGDFEVDLRIDAAVGSAAAGFQGREVQAARDLLRGWGVHQRIGDRGSRRIRVIVAAGGGAGTPPQLVMNAARQMDRGGFRGGFELVGGRISGHATDSEVLA